LVQFPEEILTDFMFARNMAICPRPCGQQTEITPLETESISGDKNFNLQYVVQFKKD